MKNNRGKIKLFDLLRTLSLIVLIIFGFVTIIASGGDDDDDDEPEDVQTYSIQGTITADSEALANITVGLTGDSITTTTTGDDGSYTFSEVEDGDYTIIPNPATGYQFDPVSIDVTVNGADVTGQDFTATQISAAKFLHYSLPDQYSYEGLVEDEAEALFPGYTLTDEIVYAWDQDTEDTDEDGDTEEYIPVEYVSGYALDQFVDKDTVNAATPDPEGLLDDLDARELYTVAVYSHPDDGAFSNRMKFVNSGYYNYDLTWDQFITGYLLDLNYSGKVFFPSSVTEYPTLAKMYNVKYSNDIYMFRKIDVKMPDAEGTIVTFEPQATTDYYVDDDAYNCATSSDPGTCPGDGLSTTKFDMTTTSFGDYADIKVISMDQFIIEYVTDTPESYTYKIVALDGTYEEGWTYEDMEDAYYLVDYDLILRLDTSGEEIDGSKINFPLRIEVVSDSTVEYDNSTVDPPAFVPSPYEVETE